MRRPRFVARGRDSPAGRRPDPDRGRRGRHGPLVAGRGRRPRARSSSPGMPASPPAGSIPRSTTAPPRRTTSSPPCTTPSSRTRARELYDHPALAERFAVAADAKSATFTLRKGIKFHNGDPVTPQDVKFSYENYRGAKADVFKKKTERVEIVDDRTIRFVFKEPFLDFAILFGTANVAAPRLGGAREVLQAGRARTPSSRSPSARAPTSSSATSRA